MALIEEFEAQGRSLFKGRSYLPVAFVPLFIIALGESNWLELAHGDVVGNTYETLCVTISMLGFALRVYVAGTVPAHTSGRNTRKGQVAHSLNTTGAYSVVRHPLYLGNFLIFYGLCLAPVSWWFAALSILAFALYYERIMFAEEGFLREQFGDTFERWSRNTPAFVPDFSGFRSADLPFSWRTAIKREYLTIFGIVTCYTLIEYGGDLATSGMAGMEYESSATLVFGATLILFLVIRYIRKQTRLLNVAGR